MTRYHFDAAWSGQQLHENDCLVPWDKGEWVRFKDAQADKAKLVEALEALMVFEDDSDAYGTEWYDAHKITVEAVRAVLKEVE